MTTYQRNAHALARMSPGGVIHTRTPKINIVIKKGDDGLFTVMKQYSNGGGVRIPALSGAGVLDELERMNISIGG